jgi:hypothetical protein
MKRIGFWFLATVVCIVLPAVVAEFGANLLSPAPKDEFLAKALIYVIGFQFTLAISLAFNWELERGQISRSISIATQSAVVERIQTAIDGGLIKLFVTNLPGTDVAAIFRELADMIATRLRNIDPPMLTASSVFLRDQIGIALNNHDAVLGSGFVVDIEQHLRTTRHLCARYPSYLQIQRRAFKAPEEWTADWLRFLEEMSKKDIEKKYIVLASAAELKAEKEKLESMRSILTANGFKFGVCNSASVTDSTGGSILTVGVIEVFGGQIIKIGDLPEGRYQGGIKLNMLLLDGQKQRDILGLAQLVEKLSENI